MEETIIDKIKALLKQNMPDDGKAFLYGSRATGKAHEGSDWDILVILNKDEITPDDDDKIIFPLTELGWETGEYINPVIYTAKEWEESKATSLHNVMKEAIYLL